MSPVAFDFLECINQPKIWAVIQSMEGLKRNNPFIDDDFMKQVTKKMQSNPNEYSAKIQEEFNTPALECTLLHIGRHP